MASPATISLIVSASSAWTSRRPGAGAAPPGRCTAAEVGQPASLSALFPVTYAENVESGKPRSAHSRAGATTCAKVIVPARARAVHQASGEAGTTVRRSPTGISPSHFVRKNSEVARRGYGPTPDTSKVSPELAWCTRIGATPAKLTMSGCTTPSVSPAATPASMALPPSDRIRAAACAASG